MMMAPRYPGAVWRPTGGNGGSCRARACSWHEAVTTAASVFGWNQLAAACHGFVAQDGNAEQYVDFSEAVNGVKDDNGSVLTWETWDNLDPATNRSMDGSFGPNDRRWTDQQAERIIDIMAWMSGALGIPVRWMDWTNERGHAPHRLGVRNPDGRVQINTGPASWTKWDGKQCPGDLRVLQLRDEIIPAAARLAPLMAAGRVQPLPPGPVNVAAARARYNGGNPPPNEKDWFDMATQQDLETAVANVLGRGGRVGPGYYLVDSVGYIADVVKDLAARLDAMEAALPAAVWDHLVPSFVSNDEQRARNMQAWTNQRVEEIKEILTTPKN